MELTIKMSKTSLRQTEGQETSARDLIDRLESVERERLTDGERDVMLNKALVFVI